MLFILINTIKLMQLLYLHNPQLGRLNESQLEGLYSKAHCFALNCVIWHSD